MVQLNDLPRQKLREIVALYGRPLGNDSRRYRSLLMDFCGEYQREVNLLVSVLEEPGALDLLTASSMPPAMQVAQVTKRLHENRGLAEYFARWGVISWALALGLISEQEARALDTQTAGGIPPVSSPSAPPYPPVATPWQPPMPAPYYPPVPESPPQPIGRAQPGPPPGQGSVGIPASVSQIGKTIVIFQEHREGVTGLAWSPDGQCIASGAQGIVHVWQPLLGRTISTYKYKAFFPSFIYGIAWSPDSTHVATANDDKTVHVWAASDGHLVTTYTGHRKRVMSISWSPDGERIASSSDKTIQIWNAVSGEHILTFIGQGGFLQFTSLVAWSPNATRIASSAGSDVQVWNPNNGSVIYTYKPYLGTYAIAWSPDSSRITSGGADKTVQVWEAETGSYRVTCRGHTDKVNAVAFSPDGRLVASASDDCTVRIWNSENGQHLFTYEGHTKKVNRIAWSPDGKYIASASDDKLVHVWISG